MLQTMLIRRCLAIHSVFEEGEEAWTADLGVERAVFGVVVNDDEESIPCLCG